MTAEETKPELTLEEKLAEYKNGLVLSSNNYHLETYLKDVQSGKKSNSTQEFNQLVSLLKTNGEDPKFLLDATTAHVETEAKQYLKSNAKKVDEFLTTYKNQIINDYFDLNQERFNKLNQEVAKDLEKAKTPEEKQAIQKQLALIVMENIGRIFTDYTPIKGSNQEIEQHYQSLKNLEGKSKDEIEIMIDSDLTKKYDLACGTKGLHMNYGAYAEQMKQMHYRILGKQFVQTGENGEIQLNKDLFEKVYGNEETLKKLAPVVLQNNFNDVPTVE